MLADTWMTVSEAAEELGVTPGRVRQILAQCPEELGAEKLHGGIWLLQRVAVRHFARIDRPRGNPNFRKAQ